MKFLKRFHYIEPGDNAHDTHQHSNHLIITQRKCMTTVVQHNSKQMIWKELVYCASYVFQFRIPQSIVCVCFLFKKSHLHSSRGAFTFHYVKNCRETLSLKEHCVENGSYGECCVAGSRCEIRYIQCVRFKINKTQRITSTYKLNIYNSFDCLRFYFIRPTVSIGYEAARRF